MTRAPAPQHLGRRVDELLAGQDLFLTAHRWTGALQGVAVLAALIATDHLRIEVLRDQWSGVVTLWGLGSAPFLASYYALRARAGERLARTRTYLRVVAISTIVVDVGLYAGLDAGCSVAAVCGAIVVEAALFVLLGLLLLDRPPPGHR